MRLGAESTVHKTLDRLLPVLLERIGASSISVFASRSPAASELRYAYPRVTELSDAALTAASAALRSGVWTVATAVPLRYVYAWPVVGMGSVVVVAPTRYSSQLVRALDSVFASTGAIVDTIERCARQTARVEAALADTALLTEALDVIPECVIRLDVSGLIVFVSAAWSILTGVAPSRSVGHDFRQYLFPTRHRSYNVEVIEGVASGSTQACWVEPLLLATSTGRSIPVRVSLEALRDEFGRPCGAAGSIVEIRGVGAEPAVNDGGSNQAVSSKVRQVPALDSSGGSASGDIAAPMPLVLIADDSEANAVVLRKMLATLGLRAIDVRDGKDVVAAVARHGVCAVFLDIQMSEVHGVEAAARLRAYESDSGRAPVPVIAVTAQAMRGDEERLLAAGFDAYLSKPIVLEELRNVVADALPSGVRMRTTR